MEYFMAKHKLADKRNFLVCNYPSLADAREPGTREPRMIYLGVIHPNRMLEEIIQATMKNKFKLDIFGPGQPEYVAKLEKMVEGCDHITVLPPVQQHEIHGTLSNYTVGVAFYSNSNLNNFYCAPNKVFQYIMSGLNVITNDYPGLVSVVRENNIGVCLSAISADSIKLALDKIEEENMSSNITSKIRNEYSWESQIPVLKTIFCHE